MVGCIALHLESAASAAATASVKFLSLDDERSPWLFNEGDGLILVPVEHVSLHVAGDVNAVVKHRFDCVVNGEVTRDRESRYAGADEQ